MISDPVTLGVTNFDTVFTLIENGPGGRTKRSFGTNVEPASMNITIQNQDLTISHGLAANKDRDRSLFRLDASFIPTAALVSGLVDQSADAALYLVLDRPGQKSIGGTYADEVCRFMLSRMLGFLSGNATAAPDFDFSSVTNVLKWIAKEP